MTEQVSEITWTGHGAEGRIPPGAFRDFGLSVQVPGAEGDELTFKALQTYSNGEVVRWIGDEDSDNPAPTVTVTAAGDAADHHAADENAATTTTDDGGSDTLAIIALVVGVLGLVAGGVALAASRRSTPRGAASRLT